MSYFRPLIYFNKNAVMKWFSLGIYKNHDFKAKAIFTIRRITKYYAYFILRTFLYDIKLYMYAYKSILYLFENQWLETNL